MVFDVIIAEKPTSRFQRIFTKTFDFFCEIFKLIFQGMRVKCAECPNYEICSNCYALLKVAPGGVFVVQYHKIYIILFLFNYLRRYIL